VVRIPAGYNYRQVWEDMSQRGSLIYLRLYHHRTAKNGVPLYLGFVKYEDPIGGLYAMDLVPKCYGARLGESKEDQNSTATQKCRRCKKWVAVTDFRDHTGMHQELEEDTIPPSREFQ